MKKHKQRFEHIVFRHQTFLEIKQIIEEKEKIGFEVVTMNDDGNYFSLLLKRPNGCSRRNRTRILFRT